MCIWSGLDAVALTSNSKNKTGAIRKVKQADPYDYHMGATDGAYNTAPPPPPTANVYDTTPYIYTTSPNVYITQPPLYKTTKYYTTRPYVYTTTMYYYATTTQY